MSPRELSAIFNVCNELDFSQTLKFAVRHGVRCGLSSVRVRLRSRVFVLVVTRASGLRMWGGAGTLGGVVSPRSAPRGRWGMDGAHARSAWWCVRRREPCVPRSLRARPPLMAKRRAEPLVCYAPFKRLLREPPPPPRSNVPERRPRNEAAGAGPAAKRKLEEAEAPPGKRPGLRGGSPRGEQSDAAGRRRRRGEPAAPQDERTAEGSDGRRGEEPAAAPVTVRGAGRGGRCRLAARGGPYAEALRYGAAGPAEPRARGRPLRALRPPVVYFLKLRKRCFCLLLSFCSRKAGGRTCLGLLRLQSHPRPKARWKFEGSASHKSALGCVTA